VSAFYFAVKLVDSSKSGKGQPTMQPWFGQALLNRRGTSNKSWQLLSVSGHGMCFPQCSIAQVQSRLFEERGTFRLLVKRSTAFANLLVHNPNFIILCTKYQKQNNAKCENSSDQENV